MLMFLAFLKCQCKAKTLLFDSSWLKKNRSSSGNKVFLWKISPVIKRKKADSFLSWRKYFMKIIQLTVGWKIHYSSHHTPLYMLFEGGQLQHQTFYYPGGDILKTPDLYRWNALKITHLLAVSSLMFRIALWLWKLLMISSHWVPLRELIPAPVSESDENFAWRKFAALDLLQFVFHHV